VFHNSLPQQKQQQSKVQPRRPKWLAVDSSPSRRALDCSSSSSPFEPSHDYCSCKRFDWQKGHARGVHLEVLASVLYTEPIAYGSPHVLAPSSGSISSLGTIPSQSCAGGMWQCMICTRG
jgi:hypothetical protein